jgi:O-antigen/teichoic acid export membrane protein
MDIVDKATYLRNIGWFGLSKAIGQLGTWATTIIIARFLTPADYGLVGMAGLVTGIIMLFGDLGLGASIIQKKDIRQEELSSLFYLLVFTGVIFTIIIYFIAPLGGRFFEESEVTNLIRLSSVTFFINSLAIVPGNLMQKNHKFKAFGLSQSASAVAASIISVFLAWKGYGAYSLVIGSIANTILMGTLCFLYQGYIPQLRFSFKRCIAHLGFGGLVTLERYLWWYYSNISFILAGKLFGKAPYGLYSVAFNLSRMPLEKLASVITPVSFAAFSSTEKRENLIASFYTINRYLAFLMFPIFCGSYWIAGDMFPLILGQQWAEAVPLFKVLSIAAIPSSLSLMNSPLLNSIRRPDVGVKNMVLASIIATIAFVIGAKWDIKGFAVAWLVFYPPVFVVFLVNVSKVVGFCLSTYFINLKTAAVSTLAMSLCILIFQHFFDSHVFIDSIPVRQSARLIGTVLIGGFSYATSGYFVDKEVLKTVLVLLKLRGRL